MRTLSTSFSPDRGGVRNMPGVTTVPAGILPVAHFPTKRSTNSTGTPRALPRLASTAVKSPTVATSQRLMVRVVIRYPWR